MRDYHCPVSIVLLFQLSRCLRQLKRAKSAFLLLRHLQWTEKPSVGGELSQTLGGEDGLKQWGIIRRTMGWKIPSR